ncbi:pyridoxamine 5'-phosphate oxidase [Bathymodiolus japonicus methanotrophic gill symbiont]|uniref:hemerythrin domain-containing protein n=1 Tax=Bathymodiolus japonicus methanotrophic gill symbiont TaxID=113269 RepID=UPI001B753682|nr:hemerythrin domain-containing protein [Bathymodiolus japonicus methanotrophic gill symbiont]GFO71219.1 pyridoxamine 5'-phosphate oxidase [Bathymodiolus japonicus methanotrophic gill symbiont]
MEFKYKEPVAGFSDGLAVLTAYHEDFLQRGQQLLQLVANLKEQGMNEEYANQCMEVYCHYQHATHLHHQDEEQSLFPLLLGNSALVDGMIERLMMDHEEIEDAWNILAEQFRQPDKITNFDALQNSTQEFEKLLREHLTREDEDFSPHARAILNDQQRAESGGKMADMRHLRV